MSAETEIVRILRSGKKLAGREIHALGSFHDLQGTLAKLQEMSQPDGPLSREKPAGSGVFVYSLKNGASHPQDDDLNGEPPVAPNPKAPIQTKAQSGARLHEHLFRTLEQLERGEIDHVQAKARAVVADQIIKLANVQLLYEQLKQQKEIGEFSDMPLIGKS